MTETEKDMLKKLYVDEERIEKGFLLSYQRITLEQYRYVQHYLSEKYPSYDFAILVCEPMTRADNYAKFTFNVIGESLDDYYLAHVYGDDINQFTAKDNFYNRIISEEFSKYIARSMNDSVNDILFIQTTFTEKLGPDFNEYISVDTLLSSKEHISQHTEFYVSVKNDDSKMFESVCTDIEASLKKMKLYGAYTVYQIPEHIAEDYSDPKSFVKADYIKEYCFDGFGWED